jgi:anaerobic ribonucleoside-triphosphate reductase
LKIIKRDCSEVDFDKSKISNAILKAMKNGSGIVKPKIAEDIANEIEEECKNKNEVSISDIESMVYDKLITKKQRLTAKAYEGYRSIREFQRDNENTTDEEIQKLVEDLDEYWKDENANKNPVLNPTKRDYIAGSVSTDATKRYLLSPEIIQAHNDGILHFHDADYFIQHMHNCGLVNLEDMLQNNTVISETLIETPHALSTACNIATQAIAQIASNQYGGQSISLAHLAPFVDISRKKIKEEVEDEITILQGGIYEDQTTAIYEIVEKRLVKEIEKSVQTIQYQLVTLMTTNGQAPFITIFMYLNEAKNEQEKHDLALLIEEMLRQRIQGVKNEDGVYIAPAFPKLIYVLEEDNITEDSEYWYLTELAAECTSKRLVPDYISEKMMLELKGDVYTCMGCVDGKELVTYKIKNNLYVESFERMWRRLSDSFEIKHQYSEANPNLYMDLSEVTIYDTEKGFVETKRIIRNVSSEWLDVDFSNGRRLLCTTDHPLTLRDGRNVHASELKLGDKILINSNQYNEESILFNTDKAWLLGFMLCDGCYQNNHVFASIAATGEDEIEEKFSNTFTKYFGLNVKTILQERGKKGTYKDLCAISDNNGGIQYVTNYFTSKFGGINKVNRQIPNEVFSWNYEAKLAFFAGMIDADGYINSHQNENNFSTVQIGSTNKELALQQMALAQSIGIPAKIYHNHYTKKNPELIRYRVEFYPTDELINYIVCKKKCDNYIESNVSGYAIESEVIKINSIHKEMYSYDVTTSSEHFEVSGIYSHNCRSFLTVDRFTDKVGNIANAKNFDPNKHKYYGRFNQGVVTISLPDIAFSSDGDFDKFWEIFEERTELCHKALRARHERLLSTSSDVAPILWQHGAYARLKKHEKIDRLLYDGYSTISLGYAGLYECVKFMTGHSHSDEGIGEEFGLKVMQALNDKCNQWKQAENIDYSLYGTPLESTTYKFAKCLKSRFGSDIFEKLDGFDRNYITNSYHIPVFEHITAFEKLRIESKFQKLSPGGAISYIEVPSMSHNIPAILEVIKFIYNNIMYAEINTKSCYCEKCGFDGDIPLVSDENNRLKWKCPSCGNTDNTTMDIAFRVCGYIGTAKNGGNQGRYGDIHDRVYHLDDMEYTED